MKYEYQLTDKLTISGEVQKLHHVIRLASFVEELPESCPICDSDVRFFFRNPKGFEYYPTDGRRAA